jgi:hypothetical protein
MPFGSQGCRRALVIHRLIHGCASLLLIAAAVAAAFAAFALAVVAIALAILAVLAATAFFAVALLTAAARRLDDVASRGGCVEAEGSSRKGDNGSHQKLGHV